MLQDNSTFKLTIITATHKRSDLLATVALPSLQRQTCCDFEWVVVNDGCDLATRELIAQTDLPCSVRYLELPHPQSGFGLCHARNLGLAAATGDLIAYMDDDNSLAASFVAATRQFFEQHPDLMCSMVQQQRRRDLVVGETVVPGVSFVSPGAEATAAELLLQQELFDSNGFCHRRHPALQWNPEHRVFADYEFFLRCVSLWGAGSFGLQASVLVDYVQRSDGVIGRSCYGQWAAELRQILGRAASYPVLVPPVQKALLQLVERWQNKACPALPIAAFWR